MPGRVSHVRAWISINEYVLLRIVLITIRIHCQKQRSLIAAQHVHTFLGALYVWFRFHVHNHHMNLLLLLFPLYKWETEHLGVVAILSSSELVKDRTSPGPQDGQGPVLTTPPYYALHPPQITIKGVCYLPPF